LFLGSLTPNETLAQDKAKSVSKTVKTALTATTTKKEDNTITPSKTDDTAKPTTNKINADIKEEISKSISNVTKDPLEKDKAKTIAKVTDVSYQVNPLMLSQKEYSNLKKALSSLINKVAYTNEEPDFSEESALVVEEETSERSYIYLASLLYFNQKSWVVWINDRKITSAENDPKNEFYIKNITKSSAELIWKLGITKWKIITGKSEDQIPEVNDDNQIVNSFKLKPNQTYVLIDNSIVEGRIRAARNLDEPSVGDNNNESDDLGPINNSEEFNFF